MYEDLNIIAYPDPRLKKPSAPISVFDENLRLMAARMFELMRQAKGVGLAAPQVAQNIRLFVMNATGQPEDDRVYINPILSDAEGEDEAEEGCLSIPGLTVNVVRSRLMRIQAQDLDGRPIDQVADGFVARVWQHEFDHLNGMLIIDRMGPVAKLTNRRLLRDLEEQYAADHPAQPTRRRARSR